MDDARAERSGAGVFVAAGGGALPKDNRRSLEFLLPEGDAARCSFSCFQWSAVSPRWMSPGRSSNHHV